MLIASVIYYGVQMSVCAVLSGYLRNCHLHMLPDQVICKKRVLKVSTVSMASIYCETQDNSLHGPVPAKGKQQPVPRNHGRKVLILKNLVFPGTKSCAYCNQKKFPWSLFFTEILLGV